jgi:hypothetical protein
MPFVTVEEIGGGRRVYQVGRKSLQLLTEVHDRTAPDLWINLAR